MSGKWKEANSFGNHRKQTERLRGKKSPGGQTGWAYDSNTWVESRVPMGTSGGACCCSNVDIKSRNGNWLGRVLTC